MNRPSSANKFVLILVILLLGAGIAFVIIKTAPKPERNKGDEPIRLVETTQLERSSKAPEWHSGGEVIAKQKTDLTAQVSGAIKWINPEAVPGAQLKKGTVLARIDDADYQLMIEQREASLVKAEADLLIEQGQAAIAQEEYQLASQQVEGVRLNEQDVSLVLRKPQIKSAQAALKSAQASLKQAQLDLARSYIRMPFDGTIVAQNVNVGAQVNSSMMVFEVMDNSEFWIEAKISRSFIAWLDKEKSIAITSPNWPEGSHREAQLLNVLSSVNVTDRQTKVLLSVKDPLALSDSSQQPVFLNDYLDLTFVGKNIENAYVVDTSYLKQDSITDADQVWVVNNNKLYKRNVSVRYQGREKAWLTSGIESGDVLLTSSMRSITNGTTVRITDDSSASSATVGDAQ